MKSNSKEMVRVDQKASSEENEQQMRMRLTEQIQQSSSSSRGISKNFNASFVSECGSYSEQSLLLLLQPKFLTTLCRQVLDASALLTS